MQAIKTIGETRWFFAFISVYYCMSRQAYNNNNFFTNILGQLKTLTNRVNYLYHQMKTSGVGGSGGGVSSYNDLHDKPFTDDQVRMLKEFLGISNPA